MLKVIIKISKNCELIAPIYEPLKPFETRIIKALLGDIKQKLTLCCTLIYKPEILFLDELTRYVDVVSYMEFWDILQILKTQMSVIISTPYMDKANRCDEITLINKGKFLNIAV